jgi:GntR family transcriptional regulator
MIHPLYTQIKQSLLKDILDGRYPPGAKLPSQRELCANFSTSHMTIRRVINELLKEGIVQSIPGKGLYVISIKQNTIEGLILDFTKDQAQRGITASSQLLAGYVTSANKLTAQTLQVEPGANIIYLHRLCLADGVPLALQTSYLVHAFCPHLLEFDLSNRSLFAILRDEFGLWLESSKISLQAVLAGKEDAQLLELALPSPLLTIEQVTFLHSGRPVEFTRTRYRGDRYRFNLK